MRKEVGEAAVKVGTNIATAGGIGLVFLHDGATMANSIVAIICGFFVIFVGIRYRDGGSQ